MRTSRLARTIAAVVVCATLASPYAVATAEAQDNGCLPGIADAFVSVPAYARLYGTLLFHQPRLQALLRDVGDQATYQALLNRAELVASSVPNGRVVITLPDGTVVLDTAGDDDPGNTLPEGNSYQHFVNKTVNENHNTRVAILSAQLYPCGVGLERKPSTTTGATETYFAVRLGRHLNNAGTARLSLSRD